MIFVQFAVFNFSPFIVSIVSELSLTYTQVGLVQTALFIPYTIAQVLVGPVVDKYPSKNMLVLAAATFVACSIMFALSTQLSQLLLLQAVKGIAMAFIFVISVRQVLANSRGTSGGSMSFYSSSFAMGPLLVGFVTAAFTGLNESWRTIVLAMNLTGLLPLLLLFTVSPVTALPISTQSMRHNVTSVLARRESWVLGYDQFLRFGVVTSFSTWIPTFLVQSHSFSPLDASLLLGAGWTTALIFIVLGGLLAGRTGNSFLVIELAILCLAPAALLVGGVSNYVALWGTILCFSALMNFHFAPLFSILPDIFGSDKIGLVTGIEGAMASTGAFTLPAIFGFVRDTSGSFSYGWYVVALLATIGAFSSVTLRSYRHRNSA